MLQWHHDASRFGETWDLGVREPGSLEYVVRLVRGMAARRDRPERIAASALHFIVAEHPFWDANHRTGFHAALVILGAFGLQLEATQDEIERTVRAIDAEGLDVRALEKWIQSRAVPTG